ncbi:MAG TPA: low molecular weight protein-tyrosine-phosphatase [Steroidobacteraceae bacterium]|nr:low molecular weight protein-tyrosine-phosphatase [Steroidobacteraceae bacterium]HNS26820.1 low molecular weight protein-tyrosine-phosphatase [Steroidobacteraceae bacterium]
MKILLVCLGNICRSPTAEGVLRALAQREAPQLALHADSAGTAGYHIGAPPDPRTLAAARRRGYDLSDLRARQVQSADFSDFDLLLAMDEDNLASLRAQAPPGTDQRLKMFLEYAPELGRLDVPDPYYGTAPDFDLVVDLVERGARGLLRALATHSSRSVRSG